MTMVNSQRSGLRLRHLVMVNRPGWQAPGDFAEIASRIMRAAPDIGVFIADYRFRDVRLEETAATRPTLVFSPCARSAFFPRRGTVAAGRAIDKPTQLQRLQELGLPVPKWQVLEPDAQLDPAEWGTLVLLKPTGSRSAGGTGFVIAPTATVRYVSPQDYPEGHHGRSGPLMAQAFIRTGVAASHYRVCTLFGAALYAFRDERTEPLPDLSVLAGPTVCDVVASNTVTAGERTFSLDVPADVLSLARRCHDAFPEVPLKGVDIVRDVATGELFVLELNCTSNTWHISSNHFAKFRTGILEKSRMVKQYGAWDVAATTLIAKTRELAR